MAEFSPATTQMTTHIHFMYYKTGTGHLRIFMVLSISQTILFLFLYKINPNERSLKTHNWKLCPKRTSCQFCRFINKNNIKSANSNQKIKLKLEITFWYSPELVESRVESMVQEINQIIEGDPLTAAREHPHKYNAAKANPEQISSQCISDTSIRKVHLVKSDLRGMCGPHLHLRRKM